MLVGWVLIIVGVLNFFTTPIFDVKLMPAHGIFHILAGLLGVWSAKSHARGYVMWVGIVGIVLAVIGFLFGAPTLLGLINLPTWISVIHLVLGIWGLWTYYAGKKSSAGIASPMSAGI